MEPRSETGDVDLTIRPATLADVRPLAEFQTACWQEAYRGMVSQDYLDRVTAADREQRWGARLRSGERQIALALHCAHPDGNEIAGVVSWAVGPALEDVPALELTSLYVGAAHRSQGLGRRLARYALQDRPAHLWVFAENHRAQAFYAGLGFVADGGVMVDPDTGLPELRWVRR